MSDFMISFSWINLFAASAPRTHVIIDAYSFLSQFLASHSTLFICSFGCMTSPAFSTTFAPSFLMSWGMLLTLTSCIITSDLSRRRAAVEATSLTQKSLDFSIFLLSSKTTLKIINFLNLLTPTISLRAVSVSSVSGPRARAITSAALILCTRSISCSPLIHVISSISLLNLRFGEAPVSRRGGAEIATPDCLAATFAQVFSPTVSFVFSTTLFNFLITSSSLVTCLSEQPLAPFAPLAHSWRVASLTMSKNLAITVHGTIPDRFFSFDP